MPLIYKVFRNEEWESAVAAGRFTGSAADVKDGFIHFSTREQLDGTLRKHFAGEWNLVIAAVDASSLGDPLRWEPSRNGELFPHLYEALKMELVFSIERINLDDFAERL